MARDGDNASGRDGDVGTVPPLASPLGYSRISVTVGDAVALLKIQLRWDANKCVSMGRAVGALDDVEIIMEAVCSDDVARQVTEVIVTSSSQRPDAGLPHDTSRPQQDMTLDRLEARLTRGEGLSDVLLEDPPGDFGASSRHSAPGLGLGERSVSSQHDRGGRVGASRGSIASRDSRHAVVRGAGRRVSPRKSAADGASTHAELELAGRPAPSRGCPCGDCKYSGLV
jgi:hypothetical protein